MPIAQISTKETDHLEIPIPSNIQIECYEKFSKDMHIFLCGGLDGNAMKLIRFLMVMGLIHISEVINSFIPPI